MNSLLAERLLNARIRGVAIADDLDTGLIVEYIGSSASGTVEVSSAGDITFKHGAVGSEAVDSTIDSGGNDPGVIDVSDSNANTFGEVVDMINASANWKAYLVDVLRSDSSNASTGSLLEVTATQAKVDGGVALLKDTSKVLNMSVAIKFARTTADTDGAKENGVFVFAKELGKFAEVLRVISNNTFGSGTSLIRVYRINRLTGSETKVYERSGAATTVEQDLDLSDQNGRGLACEPDEYLLVRIIGSAACTGYLQVNGRVI